MSDFRINELNPGFQFSPIQLPTPFTLHGQIEATIHLNQFTNSTGSIIHIPKESLMTEVDSGTGLTVTATTTIEVNIPTGGPNDIEIPIHNIQNGAFVPGVPFNLQHVSYNGQTGSWSHSPSSVTISPTIVQELLTMLRIYNMLDIAE